MTLLCVIGVSNTNAQTVAPMIKAKYSQCAPYNNSCPDGTVAGCGPVAIAQIMTLYKIPAHGYGVLSYKSGGYNITADFGNTAFGWNDILDNYKNGTYSDTQAKAVADLIYACGAAMHATYGTSTSIGNYAQMLYGLQHHLHFSVDSRYLRRKFYSTAEWIEILNRQLRDGHPVFYRGTWFFNDTRSDHMFVVDGIDEEGAYHVNFGHGGSGDKFADINVINQSGTYPGGRGVCYNASQAMVINCYPTPDYEAYPLQRCVSEEYIILNNDMTINTTTVSLGETFTLSCKLRNYSAEKANVNYGWALVKDGNFIDIVGLRTYGLGAGNQFSDTRHLNVSLPHDLSDGTYKLELYSKSDIEPKWNKIWACAPTDVDVSVNNGRAVITVPDNHQLDPMLYLDEDIKEVDNEFAKTVPGRSFALVINNPSINNFENILRLDIVADGGQYSYETTVPVFSQTSTEFHFLIPQEKVDLQEKEITSITASYYYDWEKRYVEMTTTTPSSIETLTTVSAQSSTDIYIYSVNGVLVRKVRSQDVNGQYGAILEELPHGIYIVKEGNRTRNIAL